MRDARPVAGSYGHIVLPIQRQGHIKTFNHPVFSKEQALWVLHFPT